MELTVYEIARAEDLQQLLRSNPLWRKKLGLIILPDSLSNPTQTAQWQNQLNELYYACGCDEGAKGFFAGIAVSVAWLASVWFRDLTPTLSMLAIAVLLTVIGSLLGKAVGKLIAARQLKRLIETIQLNWHG